MPGRRSLRPGGGGGRDKDKDKDKEKGKGNNADKNNSRGGTRTTIATFWANASYKSFAKPHFRETDAGGSRSDFEEEELGQQRTSIPTTTTTAAAAAVAGGGGDAGGGGHGRLSMHHHPHHYESDSTPSLSQHRSQHGSSEDDDDDDDDDDSHEHHHRHHPTTDPDLERGGVPRTRSPGASRTLRIPDKRTPTPRFTTHQLLYVFGSHGVGAFVISGGINFAIAYAMYTRTDDPIDLFEFPNTLLGDFAVTVIMQTIITWFVEMLIVNHDLRRASIQPIGFIDEPLPPSLSSSSSPSSSSLSSSSFFFFLRHRHRLRAVVLVLVRWFMLLDQPKAQRKRRGSLVRRLRYVVALAVRAFLVAVVAFALLVGPTVGILIALGVREGGDWVYASRWTPEIYKLLLGGVLALLTSPFFAMYWMVKCGWNGGIHESVMISGNEIK